MKANIAINLSWLRGGEEGCDDFLTTAEIEIPLDAAQYEVVRLDDIILLGSQPVMQRNRGGIHKMHENFRVWHIQNAPNDPTYYYVRSPDQGERVIRWLIELDLLRKDVDDNAFGLEERVGVKADGSEWTEWYDENGESVMDKIDRDSAEEV